MVYHKRYVEYLNILTYDRYCYILDNINSQVKKLEQPMKEKELLRLIEISKLYYDQNKTQAEIARIMDISRPLVSNLLNKARKEGVVKIDILSYQHSNLGLSQGLCRRFNLKSCHVVSAAEDLHQAAAGVLVGFLIKQRFWV